VGSIWLAAIPNSKPVECIPAPSPSSPNPCLDAHNLEETSRSMRRFSQFWEKGSRRLSFTLRLPLPSLGAIRARRVSRRFSESRQRVGVRASQCRTPSRISEFGIAVWLVMWWWHLWGWVRSFSRLGLHRRSRLSGLVCFCQSGERFIVCS
jgi:hypothetical protein